MPREYMCSSYTVSGLMPGQARAARHSLDDRLHACRAAGYSGMWMHFRDYAEQRAAGVDDAAMRSMFDQHAMKYRGVEFLTDWFLDTDHARAAEDTCLAAARAIDATVISVGGDFANRGIAQPEMTRQFARLCERARDHGISVALEFVPWSNVPDIQTALAYLEPENAGLMVDCWHLYRGGMTASDIGAIPAGKIMGIQVNDADSEPAGPLAKDTLNRKPCGEGAFDLAGFAAALDAASAAAPFSIEIISPRFVAMPVEEAARVSLETARAVFG